MIAVDTNVVVRLLTQDDETQSQQSLRLFQDEVTIFIPTTVILETAWVLRAVYEFKPGAICAALRQVLGLTNVQVKQGQQLALALQWYESGLDFADALHLAQSQGCEALYTFDQQFVKRAQGLANGEARVVVPD
ncbi:MAG: type II toxin-antitoxin system VapC family toxin [Leptolyngbya sp. RL_3_1]|nr:type II toxin-antitoxin system VapC family toxin [Leptolyngbya sp. RL_3_1]